MKKLLLNACILLCVMIGVGVAARSGYILPGLGQAMLLFFPPADLWHPLDTVPVQAGQDGWDLSFFHKYPGPYALYLNFARPDRESFYEQKVTAVLEIRRKDQIIHACEAPHSQYYYGHDSQGLGFCAYEVPGDAPLHTPLHMSVRFQMPEGGIDALVTEYGEVTLTIVRQARM